MNFERELVDAVRHFWKTRDAQTQMQTAKSGPRDAGTRSAVTGGKQMNGFVNLARNLLIESGIAGPTVFCERNVELPGWFRPEKCWDLLVVINGSLVASIEFKSQVGSFGNNYNNRTEEALGSATDIWAAYREGAFKPSARPWLGYLMLLEEAPGSIRPVRARAPHFKVFPEFQNASYATRYDILLTKLLRERLYDGACLLLSDRDSGRQGIYREPNIELSFRNFAEALVSRAVAHAKTASANPGTLKKIPHAVEEASSPSQSVSEPATPNVKRRPSQRRRL